MSSSPEDNTIRGFQIFMISILTISLVFGLVVALWGTIKNKNNTSAPIHYYSAPAYHVASPVHSRYSSPNYDPDLSSPAASRYAPAGPQSCPTSDPTICCDCNGAPASSPQPSPPQPSPPQPSSPQPSPPQPSPPQPSAPQGCDEDGNYCDPENPIIGCDNTEFCTNGKNKCSLAWYLGPDKQCSGSPFICEDNNTILTNSALSMTCEELYDGGMCDFKGLGGDPATEPLSNLCPVRCGICSAAPVRAGPIASPVAAPQPVPVAAPQPVPVAAPQPVPVGAPQPVPVGAPQPVPVGAPQPVPVAAPQPVPVAAPQPVPVAAPQPVPVAAPQPVPQPAPVAAPQPVPVAAPVSQCADDIVYCDPENYVEGCDNSSYCTKGQFKCNAAWYHGPTSKCSGSSDSCEDNDTILNNSAFAKPCDQLPDAFCALSASLTDDKTDDEIWNICPIKCGTCETATPESAPQPVPTAAPTRAGPIVTAPFACTEDVQDKDGICCQSSSCADCNADNLDCNLGGCISEAACMANQAKDGITRTWCSPYTTYYNQDGINEGAFCCADNVSVGDPCSEDVESGQCYYQQHPCYYGTTDPENPDTTGPLTEAICKARDDATWCPAPSS